MSVVVVCDGLRLVREAIVTAIETVPGVTRVEQAASAAELLSRVRITAAHIAIIDADLTGGIAAATQLAVIADGPVVIVLAAKPDPEAAATVLTNGANAYLLKDIGTAALARAVSQAIIEGKPRIDPRRRAAMLKAASNGARCPFNLSEREQQVLSGMSQGKSNQQIGRDLYLSEDTVKTHARRLFRKMNVGDRAHAVAVGFRSGLVK